MNRALTKLAASDLLESIVFIDPDDMTIEEVTSIVLDDDNDIYSEDDDEDEEDDDEEI